MNPGEEIQDYFLWISWRGTPAELEAGIDLATTYGHWEWIDRLRGALTGEP